MIERPLALKEIGTGSRAPRGARGLKQDWIYGSSPVGGRAPRGARGLKLGLNVCHTLAFKSRPSRGAWIETPAPGWLRWLHWVAPLAGRVD